MSCLGLFYADEPFFGKTEDSEHADDDNKQAGPHHYQAPLRKDFVDKIVLPHDEYRNQEYENQKFLHKKSERGPPGSPSSLIQHML